MRRLAILGASGHGKVVGDAASCSGWQDIVFFDDQWPRVERLCDWNVIGRTEDLLRDADCFDGVVVAIGDNTIRLDKLKHLKASGLQVTSIIHPAATISRFVTIGEGCVVFAGAVLNPDCNIGMGCIINTNATIEHDCVLDDGVHVSPGASLGGQVSVGALSWIGIGASVRQQMVIGRQVIVGAGAVVINNVPNGVTVMGVPARIVNLREK